MASSSSDSDSDSDDFDVTAALVAFNYLKRKRSSKLVFADESLSHALGYYLRHFGHDAKAPPDWLPALVKHEKIEPVLFHQSV